MAITDFLKTKTSKDKLAIALSVLQEFKNNENQEEFLSIVLGAWAKLEQFEEFLNHLVNDKPLETDTLKYIQRINKTR